MDIKYELDKLLKLVEKPARYIGREMGEIVKDKEVGLLHEKESIEDMVKKIYHLLENPQIMERFSMKATKYTRQFRHEQYTLLFNDLYSKIKR